jgi:hypothetical protein
MELKKQYGKGSITVNIDNSIQEETHSSSNIQAILVLRYDGNIDVWSVPEKPLLTAPAPIGGRSNKAPKGPMEDRGVKVSHVVTMVGSPGCMDINGTRYYW